jgi:PAS domain S-box-containing protein
MNLKDTHTNTGNVPDIVLIVDDNPANLRVMVEYLADCGFDTVIATNGKSAIRRAKRIKPGVILLDIMMPEIDGFETCRILKSDETTRDIPVIFMTALTDTEEKVKGFSLGAVDYITKPVQQEEVLARIKTHLNIMKYQRQLQRQAKALRKSEKKYRGLFCSSTDGIVFTDMDYGILEANHAFCELSGYSAQELKKMNIAYLTPDTRQNETGRSIRSQLLKRGFSNIFETELTRKDGKYIDVAVRSWILQSSRNQPSGIWGIWRDISEIKRAERMREEVDRMMHHDMKNYLNTIISFSQKLKTTKDLPDEQVRKQAKIINNSGIQMLHMIDHSLNMFKMEEGRYELDPQPCNLVNIFYDLKDDAADIIASKNLRTEFYLNGVMCSQDDSYHVSGEGIQLYNLFANLFRNALEASPKRGVVKVEIHSKEMCEITICNHGAVPKEIRDRFFERYATSGKKNGTGLGTYNALLIARTHGGNISFTTSEDDGTSLKISLPYARISQAVDIYRTNEKTMEKHVAPPPYDETIESKSSVAMPELLRTLQNEMEPRWDKVKSTFFLNEIENFSQDIINLGEKYNLDILTNWGNKLYNQTWRIDMERLPGTLEHFPELVDEIRLFARSRK